MNKSKFLRLILRLYLSPILSNSRLYLFAKDLFFSRNSEHIYRSINKIKDVTSQELLKGSYIIDIGAHGDGFTSVFAENFPDCKIIAYDPLKSKLSNNLKRLKKFPGIIYKEKALGNETGIKAMNITEHSFSSSFLDINFSSFDKNKKKIYAVQQTIQVQMEKMDNELESVNKILLIKIDTQGSELNILKGGVETLKKTKFILLELCNHDDYINNPQYYEVDLFLRDHNFTLFQIYSPLGDGLEFDCLYKNLDF